MKKKNFLKIFGLALIVSLAVYNVGLALNINDREDVSLNTVEALADTDGGTTTTSFEFNNQSWNTTDTHRWGTNWKPVKLECQYNDGWSFGVTIVGFGVSFGTSGSTYDGNYISCQDGNGNCWNGTKCIKK
jgi:hypothetical protein